MRRRYSEKTILDNCRFIMNNLLEQQYETIPPPVGSYETHNPHPVLVLQCSLKAYNVAKFDSRLANLHPLPLVLPHLRLVM